MKKSSTSKRQDKTEIALKESEQRYRTIMMSVGDGVITTDTKGRLELLNPVAEALTGWLQEEARSKPLEEVFRIISEETRLTVENPVRRVMAEGIVVGLANHTLLIAKDGMEHPIADSGAPIRNEKGDVTGVVLVFRDQTQERLAQKALQESEHKFRETVKNLDEGYYSCMMDGVLLEHNQAFNRILGFDIAKDLKGSKLPDFWQNPDDRKIYLQELMDKGFIRNFLINAKTIAGEKVVVLVNSHLVKDEKGGIVRIAGTYTDFTKLKLTEEALKESEAKYKTLFENAQVGMYRSMLDGSLLLNVNNKFSEILGFTREELLGKAGRILWADPEDRNKMMKLLKEQGGILDNYEARVLGRNGEVRDVLASIELHPDEGYLDGTMVDITDRKRAEKEITNNEKRFRELIESLPQLFWTCRVDGPCDYLSKQWVEYTGIPETEQLGYRWLEQLHPEDRDGIVSEWLEKVKIGNSFDIVFRIRRNDGEYRWFKTTAAPMRDAKGNIIKWFGSNTDIDEIKKTKEHLRKLNRIYSLLSEINQAIVRTRVPKELFEKACNIAVEQGGFGMAWIGLIDESSQKLRVIVQAGRSNGYHEQANISLNGEPLSYCPIDSALRQGKHNICKIIENEEMAPCQKIAYDLGFRSSASFPLKISDILKGALTFYSYESDFFDEEELKLLDELALDISFAMEFAEKETIRNQAEKALEENERKFRETVKHLDEGYYSVTADGLLLDHNQAFNWILGIDIDKDMKGAKLPDFWQNFDDRKVYLDELITRGFIRNFLINAKKINDEKIVVMANSHLVKDEKGGLVRIEGTFTDFTELKLAEEEIHKLNTELEGRVVMRTSQLEASNKELEAFSYSVSHDLRAPLRHVSGYVELLHKHFQSALPEKGQHYLNSISDAVRTMGMLIDDLLQFSRTGRMEMRQSDFDMNIIVKDVIETMCKDNPDHKIEWVLGKLPSVYGDEAMLRLVWINLLSNAVKFTRTRRNARIEIGVQKENEEQVFFVRDNGVGFDMQYAQKLFGVFQRLHPTEEFEGTGVGLANVHRIVLRHGGHTWAEAEPDKGAVFYFTIPNK